jgi:hypothetical protein
MFTLTLFQFNTPFARKWSAPQVFVSAKMTFPEILDMHFVFVYLILQDLVKIAKVHMGGSPKKGWPQQWEDTVPGCFDFASLCDSVHRYHHGNIDIICEEISLIHSCWRLTNPRTPVWANKNSACGRIHDLNRACILTHLLTLDLSKS